MPQAAPYLVPALIGGAATYLGSREQRKVAERAAEQAGVPVWSYNQGYTMPYGPLTPDLLDFGQQILGAGQTPLPDYPEFQPFQFHGLSSPNIHLPNYTVLDLPDVPGASGVSRDIVRDILALARDKSAFVDPAAENFESFLTGEANPYLIEAGKMLFGGPLFDLATSTNPNPFEGQVVGGLEDDLLSALAAIEGQIGGQASAVGRYGPTSGAVTSEARTDAVDQFMRQAAALRAANFENLQNRQATGSLALADLGQGLAGIRSGDLRTAYSLVPALEASRFTGFDIAGPLSAQLDSLDQSAGIANNQFAITQEQLDAQYEAAAAGLLLQKYGIDVSQSNLANSLNFQSNAAQNQWNLGEFGFDLSAPFFRLNQVADLLYPLAGLTQGQYTQNQGVQFQGYPTGGGGGGFNPFDGTFAPSMLGMPQMPSGTQYNQSFGNFGDLFGGVDPFAPLFGGADPFAPGGLFGGAGWSGGNPSGNYTTPNSFYFNR